MIQAALRTTLIFMVAATLVGCGSAASPRWAGGQADSPPEPASPGSPAPVPAGPPTQAPPVAVQPETHSPPPVAHPDPVGATSEPPSHSSPDSSVPVRDSLGSAAVIVGQGAGGELVIRAPQLAPIGPGYGYRIGVGDEISVSVPFEPSYSVSTVLVRPDGMISTPLGQDIRAAGRTAAELDTALQVEYARTLRHPLVRVSVLRVSNNTAYCIGEVNSPVSTDMGGGMTVLQLIARAGGVKGTGNWKSVLLLHRIAGNQIVARTLRVDRMMEGDPNTPDVTLAPSDIVYVPRTFIAKLDQWVDQYLVQFIGSIAGSYLKGWEVVEPSRFFSSSTKTNATP